jgi:hypothetical protein
MPVGEVVRRRFRSAAPLRLAPKYVERAHPDEGDPLLAMWR